MITALSRLWLLVSPLNNSYLASLITYLCCRHTAAGGTNTDGKVIRYVITDEYRGWKGKVQTTKTKFRQQTGNIVNLFKKMDMDDAELETQE